MGSTELRGDTEKTKEEEKNNIDHPQGFESPEQTAKNNMKHNQILCTLFVAKILQRKHNNYATIIFQISENSSVLKKLNYIIKIW